MSIPNAPSGLSGNVVKLGSVDLTFTDNATDETSFEVWVKSNIATTYALVSTLPANPGTGTVNATIPAGSHYYWYKVRAVNGDGASDFSNEAGPLPSNN
jgi:titin